MSMDYTVDIERSVDALANCLRRVNNGIDDIWDWRVSINAGGIDYGIYFNFDLENKELEISNQPADYADDSLYLDDIIEMINEENDDSETD
jgi:hypothetical protein